MQHSLDLLDFCRNHDIPILHAPLIIDKNNKKRYKKVPFPAKLTKQLSQNTWKSELTEGIFSSEDVMITGQSSYDAYIDSNLCEQLNINHMTSTVLIIFITDHWIK